MSENGSDDDNQPLLQAIDVGETEERPTPVKASDALDEAARGSAEETFTLSQLVAGDSGAVRDDEARAMAGMRRDREKAQHEEETLEEHADMVLTIMKPVSITMLIVIIIVKSITVPSIGLSPGQVLLYQERSNAADSSQQLTGALITGAIVLVGVLIATTAFILLYKYRCLKI